MVMVEIEQETLEPMNDEESCIGSESTIETQDAQASAISTQSGHKKVLGWIAVLKLAFQSIGIVYGDIGTSLLYVYASTFSNGIAHEDDILGVLSLIFYTITLIPFIKYAFIVLRATDEGDGGTFALYSLICRHAKLRLIPSRRAEEEGEVVPNFDLEQPSNRVRRATKVKAALENSGFFKYFLLLVTMLGTSMVIGDGVLTPCISVLSAVGGIKGAVNGLTEDKIVWISMAILIVLFAIQRYGTHRVGYVFAPVVFMWFLSNGAIGIYNISQYDPQVIKAINPQYIVEYFMRNRKQAWISLGGVVLCITGSEALFADVGHFTVRSVQISLCFVAYPSLILAYTGQASYLRHNMNNVGDTFYKSIPGALYWPMFVVAVLAAIIASQAMISGTFSVIQQSLSLNCFPKVKIIHTSLNYGGQIYIPQVNFLLMLACLGVTAGFKTPQKIGNAYGIAVMFVMTLTSSLLVLIMFMIWKSHMILIVAYILIFGFVELSYLSSVLYKFNEGGYLPLAFAALLLTTMLVSHYAHLMKHIYHSHHRLARPDRLSGLLASSARAPGIAIFHSETVVDDDKDVPPVFERYIESAPAVHSVVVFVSIESRPVGKVVSSEERFVFRRVGPPGEMSVFRCVARIQNDAQKEEWCSFEVALVQRLVEFVWKERGDGDVGEAEREVRKIERAARAVVFHLVGESEVVAKKESSMLKRVVIDYAYDFLRRNLREENEVVLIGIPYGRLLKVGMTCEV